MYCILRKFDDLRLYMEYNKVSGIYALIHHNEVIYVGQSKNVKARLLEHHRVDKQIKLYSQPYKNSSEESRKLCYDRYTYLKEHMDEIEFLVVPMPINQLNEAEEHYINKYKPKFNYSGVVAPYTPFQRSA